MPVASLNVQAVSGSCRQFNDSSSAADGIISTREYITTYSFRKTVCDISIDSDGDKLADCDEFDIGTDPSKVDTDGDGFDDDVDQCALVPGINFGCGTEPDLDSDNDGIADAQDNCDAVVNADQANLDGDSYGDACDDDIDGDELTNTAEATAGTSPANTDSDGDGLSDMLETNGGVFVDTDGDGAVDGVDLDSDGDGRSDQVEGNGDSDGDGISNWRDPEFAVHGVLALDMTIDYDLSWYNRVPNIGLFGRTGSDGLIVGGSSSASLRGAPSLLSQVKQVCITPMWRAAVDRNVTTVPVNWTEGGRDLMSDIDTAWVAPPRSILGNFASQLDVKTPTCAAGTAASWASNGNIDARTNQPGRTVNFVALQHRATVSVLLVDGRSFVFTVSEREGAATKPFKFTDFDEQRTVRFRI